MTTEGLEVVLVLHRGGVGLDGRLLLDRLDVVVAVGLHRGRAGTVGARAGASRDGQVLDALAVRVLDLVAPLGRVDGHRDDIRIVADCMQSS